MSKLHQATPCFHGARVRLRPGAGLKAHFEIVEDLGCGSADGAAVVFLPVTMGEAIRAACEAFNAVMDAHERGSAVRMLPVSTGHLLPQEVAGRDRSGRRATGSSGLAVNAKEIV